VHCLRSKAQPQARDERPFARLVTDVQTEGHEVSFLGTEGYIAPEGPGAKVSDIYSLGRLIYMAAMGRDQRQFPDLPTALVQGAVKARRCRGHCANAGGPPPRVPKGLDSV
jgi:serine/threonine protein kinase